MNKWLGCVFGVLLCVGSSGVHAVEGININGFLTAGATYSDAQPLGNAPGALAGTVRSRDVSQDGNITNRIGFVNDSRLGLQVSAKVNAKIDVTGQLLARGREDDFNLKADWAFVTYHVNDPLAIRLGKVKLTTFLISDYIEVGFAYPWIRPPQEVYSSNPISTINGMDLLLKLNAGDAVFLFQPYFGQSKGAEALLPQEALGLAGQPTGTVMFVPFTADHMVGVNTSFGSDAFSIRAGWLQTQVGAPSFGVMDEDVKFTSAGATVDWHNIVAYTEYFRRTIDGGANLAFPNQKGYYATLGYRFGKFLPHVTFAKLLDHKDPVTAGDTPLLQSSITVGFRFELGSGAALKFEAQQVKPEDGNRGLLIADPNGPNAKDPSDKVMIYGLAVDVVF